VVPGSLCGLRPAEEGGSGRSRRVRAWGVSARPWGVFHPGRGKSPTRSGQTRRGAGPSVQLLYKIRHGPPSERRAWSSGPGESPNSTPGQIELDRPPEEFGTPVQFSQEAPLDWHFLLVVSAERLERAAQTRGPPTHHTPGRQTCPSVCATASSCTQSANGSCGDPPRCAAGARSVRPPMSQPSANSATRHR
jgi:hypothetical protein